MTSTHNPTIPFSYRRMSLREAITFLDRAAAARYAWDAADNLRWARQSYARAAEGLNRDTGHLHRFWSRYSGEAHGVTFICDECADEFDTRFRCEPDDDSIEHCPICAGNYWHEVRYHMRTGQRHTPEPEDDYEDEDQETPSGVMVYSASPMRALGVSYLAMPGEKVTAKSRFFGCEIEFECTSWDQLNEITKRSNKVGIYKEDGSLGSYGAEFCTLPLSRKAAEVMLKPVLDLMVERGARAWHRHACGLHVHVTLESASWLTWGKVERFFRNNRNQALLTAIAGREPNSYCVRGRTYNDPQRRIPVKRARDKRWGRIMDHERYDALNFHTGSKPTAEFRLFRGNVAHDGVMRAIEFCDSILEFAASQSNAAPMDYIDYLVWLRGQGKAYPRLTSRLRNRAPITPKEAA